MVNQDMLAYVRGQLAAGLSRDMIKRALATGGWSDADTAEAFTAVDGVATPAAPRAPILPQQPTMAAQPQVQVQQQTPASEPFRAQPGVAQQPTRPALGRPVQPRKKSGAWQWLVILFLIVLTLLWAYVYIFGLPSWVPFTLPAFMQ